jgi:site-specific DNA-cytosine methylase
MQYAVSYGEGCLETLTIANEPGLPKPGSVDVLAMGPPCQGFTGLGWDCEKGASDREELQVALQFTKKMRPKIFICENVPGILSSQHNVHLRTFLAGLIRDDYQVQTALHVAVSCCLYPANIYVKR